jgi:serine/threonine protein kinase
MSKYGLIQQKQSDHAKYEVDIISKIENPFCVKLEKFEQDERCIYLIQEFINGGEFLTLLKQKKRLDIPSGKFFAAQMILALEYMHQNSIIYRDLKPENMLIDFSGYLKIIDFGLAKKVYGKTYTICGTPHYIAPEVLLNKGYGPEADWFSFGVVLYEMFTGLMPFEGDAQMDIFKSIINDKPKFPSSFDRDIVTLIKGLIRKDPTKRYGANKVKSHEFFKRVNFEHIEKKSIEPPFFPTVKSENDTSNFKTIKAPMLNKDNCPKLKASDDIFLSW